MLLHMMWASVLRNGLCNSYSGIYLIIQLLTTISITILHTTMNKAARTYYYSYCWQQHPLLAFILQRMKLQRTQHFALVTRWRLCVEITRTAASYGAVRFHSGTLCCHKWPHILPQWTIHAIGLLVYIVLHQRSCLQEASCLGKLIRRPYRTISCPGQE